MEDCGVNVRPGVDASRHVLVTESPALRLIDPASPSSCIMDGKSPYPLRCGNQTRLDMAIQPPLRSARSARHEIESRASAASPRAFASEPDVLVDCRYGESSDVGPTTCSWAQVSETYVALFGVRAVLLSPLYLFTAINCTDVFASHCRTSSTSSTRLLHCRRHVSQA